MVSARVAGGSPSREQRMNMSEVKYTYKACKVSEATEEEKNNAIQGWYGPSEEYARNQAESYVKWYDRRKPDSRYTPNRKRNIESKSWNGSPVSWFIARLPVPTDKDKYLVWSPSSKEPPTKILTSRKQAEVVAEKMSKDNPGEKFYIAKLEAYCEAPKVPAPTWVAE
jgi:hypothetical protein